MTINSYIESLDFDYIKTYSGFRGEEFEKFRKKCKEKIDVLEETIKTARFMQQAVIQKEISNLHQEIMVHNLRVIDKDGTLHPSTKVIAHAQKENQLVKNIIQALMHHPRPNVSGCAPVYRDAIVFYSNENKIMGILHCCFSCSRIQNDDRKNFKLDSRSYSMMKNILRKVGHPIEN